MKGLTTDQKREYLRLFLTAGQDAARAYLDNNRPVRVAFFSKEEAESYQKQIGRPLGTVYIFPKPTDPGLLEFFET